MAIKPYTRPVPRAAQPVAPTPPLYTLRSVIAPGHVYNSKPLAYREALALLEYAAQMYYTSNHDSWRVVLYYECDEDGLPVAFSARDAAGLLASVRIIAL